MKRIPTYTWRSPEFVPVVVVTAFRVRVRVKVSVRVRIRVRIRIRPSSTMSPTWRTMAMSKLFVFLAIHADWVCHFAGHARRGEDLDQLVSKVMY